jgi:hypothetical protein
VAGLEATKRLRRPDKRAEHRKVTVEEAMRSRLHQHVADRGSLDGAGDHRHLAGFSRELTEEVVDYGKCVVLV